MRLLPALLARNPEKDPYSVCDIEPASSAYDDINLRSFAHLSVSWSDQSIGAWVEWLLVRWGVLRHLQVALRKLRFENRDTFSNSSARRERRLVEVPRVVFTSPRLSSTQQIIRELGLIEVTDDGWWRLTELARANLEDLGGAKEPILADRFAKREGGFRHR